MVDIWWPSQELAEKCRPQEIEVEGVESPAAGLSKNCQVLSCEDVPETHLHVCQVNVGEEEARQIVCGAPNVRAGIKVMSLQGARIADNYKIKRENPWLRVTQDDLFLGELGISDSVVPKNLQMGFKSCLRCCSRR